jgi:hypothetical protein
MRAVADGIKKTPYPEEAAQWLSRRTYGGDPTTREFCHTWKAGIYLCNARRPPFAAMGRLRQCGEY